ncbi:MAG: FliH/SctL family protein [Terriglobales bacterium]|jgi:flagellar assembly protein FliH
MSSSATKRQLVPEPSLFTYADAGAPGSGSDAGQPGEGQSRRQHTEAFEQGRQSAQQQLRSELDAALAKQRAEIGRALHEFALERQNYYRRIEGEVVELALAIARKILHREVQIDPHALAGIVRVTLEKLDTGTKVILRVHAKEATDWRHYFACQLEDVPAPDVHEDPAIPPGECHIETSLGSTEVGLESQLKEIETGLLDLLAERPGASAGSAPAAKPASPSTTLAPAPEQKTR